MKLLAALSLLAWSTIAAADTKLPQELEGIDIVHKPGAKLPTQLEFLDHNGKTVHLSDYVDGQRPLLLILAYYQCPMLCSIVMNGLVDGLRGVGFDLGSGYRVLTVSIDPRDTVQTAQAKRKNYIDALGKPGAEAARAWDFLLQKPADAQSIKVLADTVGFKYRWDEKTQQFAHAAGVFLFTPYGHLSRTLYGIQFPSKDLKLALVEASSGKLGSAWDKILLFCYHYEPGEGYTVAVMKLMRLGGAATVVILAAFLFHLWRRERNRQAKTRAEHKAA